MSAENKRGQAVALAGLALQTAFAGLLCIIWLLSGAAAAKMVFLLSLGALPIWLVSAVLFYCRHMEEVESLELAALAKNSNESALFGENAAEMRLAQRRLRWMERYLAPAATLVVSGYSLAMAALLARSVLTGQVELLVKGSPLTWGFFSLGGAFLAFLFSRYALGMAKDSRWRLLRAGGSFASLTAFAAALLSAMFFLAHVQITWPHHVMGYLVPAALLLLGAELLLNFILDFYRPRVVGAEQRPSFDSRLVNLLSEPGSIAHSIAEALNYQFGFEVSSTWFYRLLQRTFVPLLVFGLLAVVLISGVVLVTPGQQAVVLTWGEARDADDDGRPVVLGEGIHFKWPWPVQTVDIVNVDTIRNLSVGVGAENPGGEPEINGVKLYLWTAEHGARLEQNTLVARPHRYQDDPEPATQPASATQPAGPARNRDVAVSLMRIVMDIQYRVQDLYRFKYGTAGAEALLEQLASRELTRYAATRDVDTLMAAERGETARALHLAIQAKAEPLGVEIVQISLHGIHPPPEAAAAFEDVIKADREAEGAKFAALSTRAKKLSEAAGSPETAEMLADLVLRLRQLREQQADPAEVKQLEDQAEALLRQCGGQAKAMWNDALAARWQQANDERARLESVRMQLAAYKAAPELYMLDRRLQVLSEGLKDARKYVLGIERDRLEVWWNFLQKGSATGGFAIEPVP